MLNVSLTILFASRLVLRGLYSYDTGIIKNYLSYMEHFQH